jgi:hypothetical protein
LENYEYEFPKVVDDEMRTLSVTFPYVVILSQDCDLKADFLERNQSSDVNKNDKYLQEILFSPAYKAESLRTGIHLSDFGLKMETFNSVRWRLIENNQNARYHFFKESSEDGISNLVVDFKHYYTVLREDIYKVFMDKYKISINVLYRENLSVRFANYLSRIGLPGSK